MPQLVESLLVELGEDPERQGLKATPSRVSKALRQLTDGYGVNPADVISDAVFDQDYDEMVVVKDIPFYSLCEHHMLPFFGACHVGYLPRGKVVGLSKIPRLGSPASAPETHDQRDCGSSQRSPAAEGCRCRHRGAPPLYGDARRTETR